MSDQVKTILDLGNGYIKGILAVQHEEGRMEVIAKELIKTKGMRKGKILDVDELAHSINLVLESFIKKINGDLIEDIYLGVSHPDMMIKRVSEQKRILDKKILQEDLDHISKLLDETVFEPNYETIKIIPVQWVIDENIKLKDPVGMEGRKLELIADVFMLPKNFYNSLNEVFDKVEYPVADIILNVLGASEVAMDIDDKDLGTLMIDIGNNQTSYVVYEEGYPLVYGVLPIGGEDVTKDISIGMQVDIKEAEKIKREKGAILLDSEKTNDETLDIGFLSEIISARYEQIFGKISEALERIGRDGKLPGGAILIGGGSKMRNLDRLAKDTFKFASFYGRDKVLKAGDLSTNTQFVNCLGTYVWSNKYSHQKSSGWSFGLSGFVGVGWIKKIVAFFKNLF